MKKIYIIFVALMSCFLLQGQVVQLNSPLMYGGKIRGCAKNSTCVLLATNGGIFKTSDAGQNWSNVSKTLNENSLRCDQILSLGNDFYAKGNGSGNIYKSTDNGQNWGLPPTSIGTTWNTQSIGKLNYDLYALGVDYMAGKGYLYSSPDGTNWSQKALLWTNNSQSGNSQLLSFNQNKLFVYSQNNLYFTTDGSTLTTVSTTGLGITSFSHGGDGFQGDAQGNLYYRSDGGGGSVNKYNFTTESWTDISTNKIPANSSVIEFSVTDNALFIVAMPPADNLKFYKSTDQGATFIQQTATGLTMDIISNIIEASTNVFIGNSLYSEILVSSTGGSSWSLPANQFIASDAGNFTKSGNSLLFLANNRGIVRSTNQGVNWSSDNVGIPGMSGVAYFVNEIISVKDTLFSFVQPEPSSENVTLYKSTNNGTSWKASPIPSPYSNGEDYTFAGKCDSALFVNYFDPSSSKYALIVTFNNGRTWINPASQNNTQVTYVKGSKKCLFAFNANPNDWNDFKYVYKVNNFGVSFTDINPSNLFNDNFMIKRIETGRGDKREAIMDVDVQNNKAIFAVNDRTMGQQERIYLYDITNNAWSEVAKTGLPSYYIANCIKSLGNNNWLLATNVGLYKSTDNGLNWTITHFANDWLKGINVISINLLNNQVFLGTTANGIWTVNLSTGIVEPLADNDLVAYPNPTANTMQVTIPDFNGKSARVSLYGFDGKVMMTKTANSKLFQLDMHNLSSGIYLLVINSNNRMYRKTVIRD